MSSRSTLTSLDEQDVISACSHSPELHTKQQSKDWGTALIQRLESAARSAKGHAFGVGEEGNRQLREKSRNVDTKNSHSGYFSWPCSQERSKIMHRFKWCRLRKVGLGRLRERASRSKSLVSNPPSTTHTLWDHVKLTHLTARFFLYRDREHPTIEPNLLGCREDFEVLIDVSYYYQRTQ